MASKLLFVSTLDDWKDAYKHEREKALSEERYGYANYLDGKVNAYQEILDLIGQLKKNEIPFDLS